MKGVITFLIFISWAGAGFASDPSQELPSSCGGGCIMVGEVSSSFGPSLKVGEVESSFGCG